MMNPELIGRTYPASRHEASAEAMKAYARAINEDNPRFFDPEIVGGIVATPLFSALSFLYSTVCVPTDAPAETAAAGPRAGSLASALHGASAEGASA